MSRKMLAHFKREKCWRIFRVSGLTLRYARVEEGIADAH
jgi:hypothetical protein